jgi:glycosyltransferase involved in cell wall biosynthesis
MKTFLHLGSAHPRTQVELVNVERQNWGLPPSPVTPLVLQVERELELADTIVVQSRFSERTLVGRGISKDKLIRIPLGVDAKQFSPSPQGTKGRFRVLFVGQLTLRKGVQYLLETWKQLGWRDAELWLVGKVASDCKVVLRHYANLPGVKMVGYLASPFGHFSPAMCSFCRRSKMVLRLW